MAKSVEQKLISSLRPHGIKSSSLICHAVLPSVHSVSRIIFFNENIMVLFCSSQNANEVHISPETFCSFLFSPSKR